MLLWRKPLRRRLRTLEAMFWLLLARVLIRFIPFMYWRWSLGRIYDSILDLQPNGTQDNARNIKCVADSVSNGARRIPFSTLCLPRAMAVQWMLRRRGHASSLIFGIAQSTRMKRLDDLHAWVEVKGKVIIGYNPVREYRRGLTMVQP